MYRRLEVAYYGVDVTPPPMILMVYVLPLASRNVMKYPAHIGRMLTLSVLKLTWRP